MKKVFFSIFRNNCKQKKALNEKIKEKIFARIECKSHNILYRENFVSHNI